MGFARRSVEKILGVDLRRLDDKLTNLTHEVEQLRIQLNHADTVTDKNYNLLKSQRDNLEYLREKLRVTRSLPEYTKVLSEKKPLISVCIATYNKSEELIDIALKSVLSQTYQNFEVIIVGDNCTDDTEKRIKDLNDNRITFINLPNRGPYPEEADKRWMVAGAPGVDLAAVIAKGDWIARLDDDDYWSDDHLEKLLALALKTKSEFVYGALERRNVITNEAHLVYDEIPSFGQISFQGVLYMRLLNFYHYDQQSYLVEEPTDWNLVRRMVSSGIHYASTPDVVGYINWVPNTSERHR